MGCLSQRTTKVLSCGMKYLVSTILPEKTLGDVVYLPLISNVGSSSVFAIVLGEFLFGKFPHFEGSIT